MDVEILEKTEDTLKFIIRGIDEVMANTLRRAVMTEVPILAVKTVTFQKNDSAMYDEILAHRMGLVPLKFDKKSFSLPKSPEDEEKPTCSIMFTLKEVGEKVVYSGDLKSADPKACEVVIPNIPLVKLLKGQRLELEARAVMGVGLDHAKYSPCLAYLQNLSKVSAESGRKAPDPVKVAMTGPCEEVIEDAGLKVSPVEDEFIFT